MKLVKSMVVAGCAIFAASGSSLAGSKTDPFNVKASITGTCRVVAPNLDFGTIETVTGTELVTGQVLISCNTGLPFTLSLSSASIVQVINSNLPGVTVGNPDKIRYRVRLASTNATGRGFRATNAVRVGLSARLTLAQSVRPDTYQVTHTVYITY